MKNWIVLVLCAVGSISIARSQQSQTNPLILFQLMKSKPELFQDILNRSRSLEIQILYTQINRDANNMPAFKSFYFHVDSNRYFYPASTVKLPVALLALEKVNRLQKRTITKYTTMLSDSVYSGQISVAHDSTSDTGFPSVAHYIKKILVVSDNDAFNRLYEFVGQKEVNRVLNEKGYKVRILHRLERSLTPDENRHTETIRFIRHDSILYSQPMLVADSIPAPARVLKGVAHYRNDTLIRQPFDFTYKNFFSLTDQQHVLKALVFPKSIEPTKRFNITEDDRRFVLKYMSQLPTETVCPDYASDTTYHPAYVKFLMYGGSKDSISPSIRIFNKVGDAYGYLVDNAYIIDFDKKIEFMLSAVILANTDGIYNDSNYEYEKIGFPFMRNLGRVVYEYELTRHRRYRPDLKDFRFIYDRK